jgi:hypothetical protein
LLVFFLARAQRRLLPLDLVLQDTDLFDFEFDGVAMFEIPAEFEPAAVADGAGSDELAGASASRPC